MSTDTLINPDTEIDTSVLEDLDFDIPCIVDVEEHPAAWDITLTCGCHAPVCGEHLKQAQIVFREAELIELITRKPVMDCAQCDAVGIGIAFVEPIKPSKGDSKN